MQRYQCTSRLYAAGYVASSQISSFDGGFNNNGMSMQKIYASSHLQIIPFTQLMHGNDTIDEKHNIIKIQNIHKG